MIALRSAIDWASFSIAILTQRCSSSDKELTAKITEIIAAVGATSPADMGKVMGAASKQLAGLADGKAISAKVSELLKK